MNTPKPKEEPGLPVRPGTSDDPASPRELENPGDPGPAVLVPPETPDLREEPPMPGQEKPPPGI